MNLDEFKAVVSTHRDEYASVLEFQPRIEKLVDVDHCRSLQNFVHGFGSKWERRNATSTLGDNLPSVQGIYMFVWTPSFEYVFDTGHRESINWILYIGKAGVVDGKFDTIKNRYITEYRRYLGCNLSSLWDTSTVETRDQRLKRYLNLWPLFYWYLPLPGTDPKEIELAEKQLIRIYNPPLNILHTRRLRPLKSEPAF